jgi:hypothetical protein
MVGMAVCEDETELCSLVNSMRGYIHTPWVDGVLVHPNDYDGSPMSHGGNLQEHSLWTEMQVTAWLKSNHPLARGAHPRLAVAGALLHDIGKGGDCVQSCIDSQCFLDTYSPSKYDGRPDGVHPDVGAGYIMGTSPYYLTCGVFDRDVLDVDAVLRNLKVSRKKKEVALIVWMHWEFGKINIGAANDAARRANAYVATFLERCGIMQVNPTAKLMCTCILVACADIGAGTNTRLIQDGLATSVTGMELPSLVYKSSDPWESYGMAAKAVGYKQMVLGFLDSRRGAARRRSPRRRRATRRRPRSHNDVK